MEAYTRRMHTSLRLMEGAHAHKPAARIQRDRSPLGELII